MRKIYALMVLLFAVLQLPAQVLVQGRPHPTAKPQMVSPRAIADGTFTMDMIENWSGEGANRAAFVVQWNAESETSALVWGFRWDGEATGETMARAIAASDPRFFIMTETGTAYGSTVSGFGYDVNKSGDFSITKDGVTLSPDENGVIFSSSYGYDGWTCTDPEDYWQSGWYQGYWSYWLKSSDSDPWGYSGTGITGRKLTDGCWDGWNFSVNMSSQPWKPLAPAPKNGPTAPSVKVQPEDLTVSPGESVTFAPEFKGDSLYFQWYKDEVAIQDAEASSYSIVSAETSDAGRYYCVVSNMLDTISTDTVTLVVGDKSVIAAPGEEPGTALVVYDDSYASFSGILTIPQTILIEGESYTVVGIDDMAFMGCAKLTSVTFPSTLKTIGEGAFYGCSRLTSVELPAQTVSIGNYAFSDCDKLESVTFGSALETIGERAFASAKISSLVLPATVRTIGDWAFYNNPLTAITFNDGLQSIGSRAFYGVSVQTLNIPNSVTELGSYAFSGCKSLETVTIGTGVTKISDYTFNTCSALTQISCPSVTEIGASAFKGCLSLVDIPLNDKITSLGNYVFSGCSAIESLVIPNSVTSIGSYAFEKCTKLTSATLGTGISSIPDYMFSSCSALTSVVLPENITGIGKYAFQSTAFTELPLTASITEIKDYAFKSCTKLTSVAIPDRVTKLGTYVFQSCTGLESAKIGGGVTSVPNYMFLGCTNLVNVELSEKVTSIGNSAFYNCKGLKSLPVTESITSIGTNAFYGCTSLTSVNLSDKVTSLGASVFYGCSSLTEAVLGTGITTLGSSLFRNDAKLKKVVANGKIASVSTYTFNGCSSLERIYINNTPPTSASSNTFTKVPTTCRIYVPAQTCQFYAQTTYWKDFVIMPWLDELEIVSTTPLMSFDGGEALDVKPDTKTFVIEFNRTVVNTDSVSAMLIRSGFPVEDQELTVSYSGNEVTVIREGEDLPNDPYYYLVLTTSDKQFNILFKVTTATGIDEPAVEKEVRLREYYSVDGKLLPRPVQGINIVKTVYEDGSIEVSKVYVKPEDCRR